MDNDHLRTGPPRIGDQRAEYADLIERLEKATGPDRELDCEIGIFAITNGWFVGTPEWQTTPHFTASIDAALTLVPDDLQWGLLSNGYDEGVWQDGRAGAYIYSPILTPPRWKGFGATPAIALCIAALKARTP